MSCSYYMWTGYMQTRMDTHVSAVIELSENNDDFHSMHVSACVRTAPICTLCERPLTVTVSLCILICGHSTAVKPEPVAQLNNSREVSITNESLAYVASSIQHASMDTHGFHTRQM